MLFFGVCFFVYFTKLSAVKVFYNCYQGPRSGVAGWTKAPPIIFVQTYVCIENIRIEAKTICHFMMIQLKLEVFPGISGLLISNVSPLDISHLRCSISPTNKKPLRGP